MLEDAGALDAAGVDEELPFDPDSDELLVLAVAVELLAAAVEALAAARESLR
ncbi:MAG: hypothetical protein ABIP45_03265 [Knoellia sp.]